jgi:hypothetical protein
VIAADASAAASAANQAGGCWHCLSMKSAQLLLIHSLALVPVAAVNTKPGMQAFAFLHMQAAAGGGC